MSRLPRSLAVVPLAAALSATLAVPATAGGPQRPDTISLVTGSQPEGISAGPGTTFFAGARTDGAVYVGDVRDGSRRTLVPGREGEVAVGLLYDASTGRVHVAGGRTGDISTYDARTGEQLFTANAGSGRFLNDVAITRDAVYVTDSTRGEILVVPLGRGASLPADGTVEVLPVTGDYVQPSGFGLNGIRVLPGGDLIATSGGVLYVIDPETGVADRVEITGEALTGGDGLVLRGNRLYVVRGYRDRESVVVLKLNRAAGTGEVVGELTDDEFDVPTTAAFVAGDLYVVNGQFGDPLSAPTEVVRVDAR